MIKGCCDGVSSGKYQLRETDGPIIETTMDSPAPSELNSEPGWNGTAGDDELFGDTSDQEVAR